MLFDLLLSMTTSRSYLLHRAADDDYDDLNAKENASTLFPFTLIFSRRQTEMTNEFGPEIPPV